MVCKVHGKCCVHFSGFLAVLIVIGTYQILGALGLVFLTD